MVLMSLTAPRTAGNGSMRIFLALWPRPAVAQQLGQWAHDAQHRCGGRPMHPDTLHITLAFLGQATLAQVDLLAQAVREQTIAPGHCTLTRLDHFRNHRLVWAGVPAGGADEATLSGVADDAWHQAQRLGWRRPDEPFMPHVTLLRNALTPSIPTAPLAPIRWDYDSYVLVASDPTDRGPRYRVLARTGGRVQQPGHDTC
jgi:2'-5' RNA ligase